MINRITDNYSQWLRRYIKQKDRNYQSVAVLLLEEINKITSIEEFQKLLSDKAAKFTRPTFLSQDSPDPFICKLNELLL